MSRHSSSGGWEESNLHACQICNNRDIRYRDIHPLARLFRAVIGKALRDFSSTFRHHVAKFIIVPPAVTKPQPVPNVMPSEAFPEAFRGFGRAEGMNPQPISDYSPAAFPGQFHSHCLLSLFLSCAKKIRKRGLMQITRFSLLVNTWRCSHRTTRRNKRLSPWLTRFRFRHPPSPSLR